MKGELRGHRGAPRTVTVASGECSLCSQPVSLQSVLLTLSSINTFSYSVCFVDLFVKPVKHSIKVYVYVLEHFMRILYVVLTISRPLYVYIKCACVYIIHKVSSIRAVSMVDVLRQSYVMVADGVRILWRAKMPRNNSFPLITDVF